MPDAPPNSSGPTIIVGIDGSASSNAALNWAVRQATLTGEPLCAVTAWHLPTYGGLAAWPDDLDFEGDAKTILADALAAAKTSDAGIEIKQVVAEGNAALVLLDLADDASTIVVGSRGHGGFAGLLLGSVSSHIASHAHCTVVVVHDGAEHQGA